MTLTHLEPKIVDTELDQILSDCLNDYQYAAKTLFPDTFTAPWSRLHNEIFKLIQRPSRKKVIAAPRGLGKTSIARLVAQMAIMFRLAHVIPYISRTAKHAIMQTENIKRSLQYNTEVRELFGSIKVSNNPEIDVEFSKESWTAWGEVFIIPRGAGQQVRGLNWCDKRPDLIIIDDLEDKKEVQNEDNRIFLKDWFFSDVLKSVNFYADNWRVLVIDTVKHEDSLLCELLDDPEWDSLRLELFEGDFKSLAPEYMTDEEIRAEYEAHKRKNMVEVFFMEYCNIPSPAIDASFRASKFKYYNEYDKDFLDRLYADKIETVVIMDPAKTVKLHSAESAVLVIGIDAELCRYYIRYVWGEKVRPDALLEKFFDTIKRYDAVAAGVEVTSLNEWIMQPIRNKMHTLGGSYFTKLIELNAKGAKEERIRHMAGYYDAGSVYHEASSCTALETQLLAFPKSKLMDKMDCLGYLPQMLEKGERYFSVPEDPENLFSDYTDIGYTKETLEAEWRII